MLAAGKSTASMASCAPRASMVMRLRMGLVPLIMHMQKAVPKCLLAACRWTGRHWKGQVRRQIEATPCRIPALSAGPLLPPRCGIFIARPRSAPRRCSARPGASRVAWVSKTGTACLAAARGRWRAPAGTRRWPAPARSPCAPRGRACCPRRPRRPRARPRRRGAPPPARCCLRSGAARVTRTRDGAARTSQPGLAGRAG